MISDCETCDRKQVPCSSCQTSQRTICFICQGDVADPYGELAPGYNECCLCGTEPMGSCPKCLDVGDICRAVDLYRDPLHGCFLYGGGRCDITQADQRCKDCPCDQGIKLGESVPCPTTP